MRVVGAILAVVFLAIQASGATYYIDYAGGNDASAGTSKAAAWKRAPGMKGFAGTYTHTAGDRIIFKGGVTWPAACYQWKIVGKDGTAGTPDYYGVDVTWYAGGAFTRPLFDFQRQTLGYGIAGAGWLLQSSDYVLIDNLEFANHGAPTGEGGTIWGAVTICADTCTHVTLTNSIIRDWWQPNVNGVIARTFSGGGGFHKVNSGSDLRATHCEFHQLGSETINGSALWNIVTVDNCEIHDCASAIMSANVWFNNFIHDLKTPGDSAAHSNGALCYDTMTAYGNVVSNLVGTAMPFLLCQRGVGARTRVWDNVFLKCVAPPIQLDARYLTVGDTTSETYVFNNTIEGQNGGTGSCIRFGTGAKGPYPYVQVRNNHFITSGNPYYIDLLPTVLERSNNLTNTVASANSFGYTLSNSYAPTDGSDPTVGAGMDLSAYFTEDVSGVTRAAPWDIGAYEWSGAAPAGQPGTVVWSVGEQSASEESGSVTLTAHRTGGSTGGIGCSYATANGTAIAGVNYTAASGSLSWADGDAADKTVSVNLTDANTADNLAFTVTLSAPTGGASLGSPSAQTVTVQGSGAPPEPELGYLPGWTWAATNAVITLPCEIRDDYVIQPVQIFDPALAGSLIFTFTNAAGFYRVDCEVNSVDGANDSWFAAMNAEPTSPTNIWDVIPTPTVGFETRTVGNRGGGTVTDPETKTVIYLLEAGTNTFTLKGRETGKIRTVTLVPVSVPDPEDLEPPAAITILSTAGVADGHYKADSAIPVILKFSTNVTVTGFPKLLMNTGGEAVYSSGSGTTNLTFTYTVAAGENVALLDYASTNALELNGGTIRNDATDADLTLPAPGGPGSLAFDSTVTVDTTRPTTTISLPSFLIVTNGMDVTFSVTFNDTNFDYSVMLANDVVWTRTGTVTGEILASQTVDRRQTVTVRNLSGEGSFTITIPAGVAIDQAGNLSAGSGQSLRVTVETVAAPQTPEEPTQPLRHVIVIRAGKFQRLSIGKE